MTERVCQIALDDGASYLFATIWNYWRIVKDRVLDVITVEEKWVLSHR